MIAPAHSKKEDGEVILEPLEAHLLLVDNYIQTFSKSLPLPIALKLTALWHDLGKNCKKFVERLKGGESFDHSSAGAILSQEILEKENPILADLISYAISGHHIGMPNGTEGENNLEKLLKQIEGKDIPAWREDIPDFIMTPKQKGETIQEVKKLLGNGDNSQKLWASQLLGRMIFSCLVDADFLATEEFMRGRPPERNINPRSMVQMLESIQTHFRTLEQNSEKSKINRGRTDLRKICQAKAKNPQGFKTLKIPTGGGKTLISITYALEHAAHHNLNRVIYAAPYNTILEENSRTISEALQATSDELIEHHSSLVEEKDTTQNRFLSENWDTSIIITSHVQLIDSLFSNRPGKCRKLHNIANSVIILDEAQKIPPEILKPTLETFKLLVESYGCTIIFCTATQPLLDQKHCGIAGIAQWEDLVKNPNTILFGSENPPPRTKETYLGRITKDNLVERISHHTQALCIANTRKKCRQVYDQFKSKYPNKKIYHLSTWMTAADRKTIIQKTRDALKKREDLILISTSLIEAGVNLDFPKLYRELTGSDSLAQAAGRCNREAKLIDENNNPIQGEVFIFELEGNNHREIEILGQFAKESTKNNEWIKEQTIEKYFELAIWKKTLDHGLDKGNILKMVRTTGRYRPQLGIDYKNICEEGRCIKNAEASVGILSIELLQQIREEINLSGYLSRSTRKKIQRNSVSLTPTDTQAWIKSGKIIEEETTFLLYLHHPTQDYNSETGIQILNNDLNSEIY